MAGSQGEDESLQLILLSPELPHLCHGRSHVLEKPSAFLRDAGPLSLRTFGDCCLLRLGVLRLFLSPCLILPSQTEEVNSQTLQPRVLDRTGICSCGVGAPRDRCLRESGIRLGGETDLGSGMTSAHR